MIQHTDKRHRFREDEEGDALCALPECRGTKDDPIHGARQWSAIERRHEYGDWRDYLDGDPIRCGSVLELQAYEYVENADDDAVRLATGARVRYEVEWGTTREPDVCPWRPVLYVSVAGLYSFTAPLEQWMRFRWPPRGDT